jgi:probable rRNA maturation factor
MSRIDIQVSNNQNTLAIDRRQLMRTATYVLQQEGLSDASVSIAVVDDAAMRKIKGRYFDRAMTTDVLSFDLREPAETRGASVPLDCEVIVNAQRAQALAGESSAEPLAELNLYLVHGLLHQLGYDDRTSQRAAAMHEREDALLEELGFGTVFGRKR